MKRGAPRAAAFRRLLRRALLLLVLLAVLPPLLPGLSLPGLAAASGLVSGNSGQAAPFPGNAEAYGQAAPSPGNGETYRQAAQLPDEVEDAGQAEGRGLLSEDEAASALGAAGAADSLPPDAAEALGGLPVMGLNPEEALARILDFLGRHIHTLFAEALRPAAAVMAVAVLSALGAPLALGEGGHLSYVGLGSCLAVAAAALTDVQSVLALGAQTLEMLFDYAEALLPVLTTAAVSAGAPTAAGAFYAAALLFSDLLLRAAQGLILPLIGGWVAVNVAGAALGTGQLSGAARLLQWVVKTLLRAYVAAFTGYITLTGILSGSADAAAVRTTKSLLSTALPVVGRALADASEALVAGAALVRNAVGVYGLLAVLAAVALPVLRLALRYLLFKAAAALASVAAEPRISGLIDAIGSACGMVLGLVGAAAATEFLAIVALLRAVTG